MAKELDSAGLKVIQLECIIAAKDKEISLLREQLSQDQGEVINHLQQENDALKQQLQQQPPQQQQHGRRQQASAGSSGSGNGVSKGGVVELNVGGTIITTTLTALQQVPGSKLAIMFDSHNIQHQPQDSQGRFFLPYESNAVQVLVSLLQASSVFGRSSLPYIALLHKDRVLQASTEQPYLWGLIQHLGLQCLLDSSSEHFHAAHGCSSSSGVATAAGSGGGGSTAVYNPAAAAAAGKDADKGRGSHPGSNSNRRHSSPNKAAAAAAAAAGGPHWGAPAAAAAAPAASGPVWGASTAPAASPAGAGGDRGGSGGGGSGGHHQQQQQQQQQKPHRAPYHMHDNRHDRHDSRHEKHDRQQQQPLDPQAEAAAQARVAATAAAAQSAALQALTGRGPGGGSGGGAEPQPVSNLPADAVASAALKGLKQGPKGSSAGGH